VSEWTSPAGTIVPVRRARKHQTLKATLSRSVSNLPIRVPSQDWARVVTGDKGMFRTYAQGRKPLGDVVPAGTPCPHPCLLYSQRGAEKRLVLAPAVLRAFRREPLGAISKEDLAAEGFKSMWKFRYYWTTRYKKLGWRPWDEITVLEVTPMTDELTRWSAEWFFEQLFGQLVAS
jgi:hypothetical protein